MQHLLQWPVLTFIAMTLGFIVVLGSVSISDALKP